MTFPIRLEERSAVKVKAFTLAEVMVAMLFVSIALFGYVALHLRIIHSASTLHLRHAIRRKVDLQMGLLLSKARGGSLPTADGNYPLFIDDQTREFITPYLIPSKDQVGNDYTGNSTLTRQVDSPNIRHLSLEIGWNNQHGAQNYVVDTYHLSKDSGW